MDVPPLVTIDTWTQAQATLKANLSRQTSKRRVNLLRGLLTCTRCGTKMVCTPMREGAAYYRCTNALSVSQPDASKRCKTIFLQAERIEAVAWRHASDALVFLTDRSMWHDSIFGNSDEMGYIGDEESPPKPTRASLEAALAKVNAGREQILEAMRLSLVTPEQAHPQLAQAKQDGLRLSRQLADLEHREELDRKLWERTQKELDELDEIGRSMVDADDATKHKILKKMLWRAEVKTKGEGRHKVGDVTFTW
jgi:hypothetical protein